MVTKSWGYFLSETLQFLPHPASWERVQSVMALPATGPRPPTASDWQAGAETVESDGVSRIQITNNFRKQQEQPIFQKRKVNKKLLAATPRRASSHLHDQGRAWQICTCKGPVNVSGRLKNAAWAGAYDGQAQEQVAMRSAPPACPLGPAEGRAGTRMTSGKRWPGTELGPHGDQRTCSLCLGTCSCSEGTLPPQSL